VSGPVREGEGVVGVGGGRAAVGRGTGLSLAPRTPAGANTESRKKADRGRRPRRRRRKRKAEEAEARRKEEERGVELASGLRCGVIQNPRSGEFVACLLSTLLCFIFHSDVHLFGTRSSQFFVNIIFNVAGFHW
jgi:hypothetical protein